jgi:hypothetical protein
MNIRAGRRAGLRGRARTPGSGGVVEAREDLPAALIAGASIAWA